MKREVECIIRVPFAAHHPAGEGRFRRRKSQQLCSLKEGAGMLNEEETELLFHSFNSEILVKYKGKTC